jgi:diaminopimelate epimerase
MNPLANQPFARMNGLGNEILVLDLRGQGLKVAAHEARAIGRGDRLRFDQMMVLFDPRRPETDAFVQIFNIDGSLSGACGNGTRCVAWWIMRESARTEAVVETQAGLLECRRTGEWSFSVDMGAPRLAWNEIPLRDRVADTRLVSLPEPRPADPALCSFAAVNMGNPHAIFRVDDVEAHELSRTGPFLETHPMFPEKANISLARILTRGHIELKVWERGVGLTQACGSAACAAVVATVRNDLTDRNVRVTLPGGDLGIEWRESDGHVIMTGPVEMEFEGRLAPELFADTAA